MLNNVNININLEKEKYIIIGCSSGPDSMALLHYLKNNTQKKIVCAHINHNKRKESKEEELYLKNYCQKTISYLNVKKLKVTMKITLKMKQGINAIIFMKKL